MNNEKQNERTEDDQKRAVVKESEKLKGAASKGMLKRIGIYALVAMGIFLLGLIPMWFIARDRAEQLGATQRELRVARMQNLLASAAIDARRGEYEPARQAASDFFTVARTRLTETIPRLTQPSGVGSDPYSRSVTSRLRCLRAAIQPRRIAFRNFMPVIVKLWGTHRRNKVLGRIKK